MFDCLVEKGSLWRRRGGAFFALLFFFLFLLGLTPDKASANAYQTPEGYDHHDYQKLVTFLEYADGGVKNGKKISGNYDPAQPWTWLITWQNIEGTNRVTEIVWWYKELTGSLDVSGCSSLQTLDCSSNQLTSLNISGCPVLDYLRCRSNRLTFSSLPKFSGTIYTYHPQDPLPIGVGGKIAAGATVNLSAEAVIDGTATTFTWKDSTGAPINPTTDHNGVFTINEDFIGETIYCEMTNSVFQNLSLETSKVLVVPPPKLPELTTHPQDTTVAEGVTAKFNVVANSKDGGGLRYQWQVSQDGADWKNISGATSDSYTTPTVTFAHNGFQFRCQITNTKDGFSSNPVYSKSAVLSVVAKPLITSHPQNATVTEGDTVSFAVAATAPDGGKLSYQWYASSVGKEWEKLQDATDYKFIIPNVTLQSNGTRYKCQVINTRNGVSAAIESTVAVLQVIALHQINFIKPTSANDEGNPVNINSGSLVLATISGEDISEVTKITIKVDDNDEEQISPSGNTIYYLLPANISSGKHTITIKLTNTAHKTIEETVTFYWDSYRRGFGFGRFDFGEGPAEE